MGSSKRPRLAPGRQPWDPANGLRVGVLAGGLVGAALVALTGFSSFWLVALCGAAGGAIGFWTEKAKQSDPVDRLDTSPFALAEWCLVLVFIAIGFSSVMPPTALSADAPETDFSATRALRHVEVIAREPHPIGSVANREVREYLVAELEELGLDPVLQTVAVPSYFDAGGPVEVVNVYATLPGTASTGTIVLVAHYDTDPSTPGANDNSVAVATLLEAGRALLSLPRLQNDVMLLFTDGEEPAPRYGASAFVEQSLESADVALVVNFEASGNSGSSMLAEISGPESGMVAHFAAAVPDPVAFSFISDSLTVVGEIGTDFDPFRRAGVPGYHVAYLRGSSIYHTHADDLDSVSLDSLQHHGSNAMGVVKHFGDSDLATVPDGTGRVYFTLGSFFVQYPGWLSAAAASLAAALLIRTVSKTDPKPPVGSVVRSARRAAVSALAVTLAMTLAWLLITSVRSSPTVAESYFYLLCLVCAGTAAIAKAGTPQSGHSDSKRIGFSVVWVVLGLLASLAAPGFSYLFVWPALAAAIATLSTNRPDWSGTARFALVAAPTIILAVPAIEFFFQFGQPRPGNPDSNIPAVAAIAFLLTTLASGLIHEFLGRRSSSRERGAPAVITESGQRGVKP